MEDATHIRGLQLLKKPSALTRKLHPWWSLRYHGIDIGAVCIPARFESEHFLITGSTGVGKTTLIFQMLEQIEARKQLAIVLDPESEFIRHFYNENRGDFILQPSDARCPYWDPFSEFRSNHRPMDIEAFAASLLRPAQFIRDQKEEFFLDASRGLTEALFTKLHSLDEIFQFLKQPPHIISKLLKDTDAFATLSAGVSGQSAGVLTQVMNKLKAFHSLPRRDQTTRTWSAREWGQSPRGWLFLTSKAQTRSFSKTLQGLWLDSIVRWLHDRQIGAQEVWIIADEFALLDRLPRIEEVATGGRKRNVRLVLGFQNISQLRSIYGRDATETLISQPRTKVFFAGGDVETNKYVSDAIGKHEVQRKDQTRTKSWKNRSVSEADHYISRHLVMPDEIELLPTFHAYLAVRGYDRCKLVVPERHMEARYPDFVPRAAGISRADGTKKAESTDVASPLDETSIAASAFTDSAGGSPPPPRGLPTRSIWSGMVARCRPRSELEPLGPYKKHAQHAHYGGRQRCNPCGYLYPGDGRDCPQCGAHDSVDYPVLLLFGSWAEVEAEIGIRKHATDTVERIDRKGNYQKGNVVWLPSERQSANRENYLAVAKQMVLGS